MQLPAPERGDCRYAYDHCSNDTNMKRRIYGDMPLHSGLEAGDGGLTAFTTPAAGVVKGLVEP